ncbi:hypothetical protein BMS3Bbin04_01112 [bacterium BMS3Bbin04]|nr:hypothetical protein BMS3Bbin04_01112 [bacterium BMS3Bbin04]
MRTGMVIQIHCPPTNELEIENGRQLTQHIIMRNKVVQLYLIKHLRVYLLATTHRYLDSYDDQVENRYTFQHSRAIRGESPMGNRPYGLWAVDCEGSMLSSRLFL